MNRFHMYIPVKNEAIRTAVPLLAQAGISFADSMEDSNIVLYPVPTPGELLSDATSAQLVIGGNLDALPAHIRRLDLLKDPVYVAQNAAVTAEAALAILLEHLPCQLADAEILILGWGRIGKCLAQMLRALGGCVTVCARNPRDIALLHYHFSVQTSVSWKQHAFTLQRLQCLPLQSPVTKGMLMPETVGRPV